MKRRQRLRAASTHMSGHAMLNTVRNRREVDSRSMTGIPIVLVYVLSVLIIFNVPLTHRVFPNMYYYLAALGGVVMFVGTMSRGKPVFFHEISLVLLLTYIVFWACLLLVQEATGTCYEESSAIRSVVTLTWIPAFYLLFYTCVPRFNVRRYVVFQAVLATVVAALGIVQQFVSIDLFGMLSETRWQGAYEAGDVSLRTYSIVTSCQVYGLYCALYAVIVAESRSIPRLLRWAWFLFFVFAGMLSGNRSVVLLLLVYGILKLLRLRGATRLIVLVFSLVVGLGVAAFVTANSHLLDNSPVQHALDWLIDFQGFAQAEKYRRPERFAEVWRQTNMLWGNGLGCTAPEQRVRFMAPESYVMQIYAEGGVFPVVLFGAFLCQALMVLRRAGRTIELTLLILTAISFFVVHAFTSPVFFGIWGIVLHGIVRAGAREQTWSHQAAWLFRGEDCLHGMMARHDEIRASVDSQR
jgi:hypothetical protein